jgi:YVTN family beta-propeller protein
MVNEAGGPKTGSNARGKSISRHIDLSLFVVGSLLLLSCRANVPQGYPDVVQRDIPFDTHPFYPAVTPDGQYVVLTFEANALAKDRVSDDSVMATSTLTGEPVGVAIDPAGRYAYVTQFGSDSVSVVRVSNLQVVSEIPVGDAPGLLAISPDGKRIYVANTMSNSVTVISSEWTALASVPVGIDPRGIAISRTGDRAYVTCRGSQRIDVIQASNDSIVDTISLQASSIHATPAFPLLTSDGNSLYVSFYDSSDSLSGGVVDFRLADDKAVAMARYDATMTGLALVDGGRHMFVADCRGLYIYVLRTTDFAIVDSIEIGENPDSFGVVPGQEKVYAPVIREDRVAALSR